MSGLATGTRLRLAELTRQPLTLLLLFVLPPVVIELYGVAVASFPQLSGLGADPAVVGRLTGALFAVAFLAGLVGLFQVISARRGDERLVIAGSSAPFVLATRLLTMGIVASAGAVVSLAVLGSRVDVAAPATAFVALVLAAGIYGLLGIIVGTVLPRELEGSVVLVFLADLDNVLSSGLFSFSSTVSLPLVGTVGPTDFAPLSHPNELFTTAVLDGTVADGHLVAAVGWLAVLLVVAVLAYSRATGTATNTGWLA